MNNKFNRQAVGDIIIQTLAFEPEFSQAVAIEMENARLLNEALPSDASHKRLADKKSVQVMLITAAINYSNKSSKSLTQSATEVYAAVIKKGVKQPTNADIGLFLNKARTRQMPC